MPTLETPPNPSSPPPVIEPVKVRTGRFGELEEQELIHLLDSLDDERARARFRESIYISIFIWIFIAWAAIYGIKWIPFGPKLVNAPIKEEHDRMTQLDMPKDLARELARQPHRVPPPPRPAPPVATPQPAPAPPAPTQPARTQSSPSPPTPQPPVQTTPQPRPQPQPQPSQQAMVDAPRPSFQQPSQSAGNAIQEAARAAGRAQQGGASGPSGIYGGGRSPLGSGAEILTDTQGVDFGPWLRRFKVDVMRNWTPLIPESVNPPISKRGQVGIRITVLQGGKIDKVVLESRSGDVALDKAAWNALISEGTYPPLPREFPGPSIELRCTFLYNETPE